MADEDKIINIIAKYRTEGAEQAAQVSTQTRQQMDMFGKDFAAFNETTMNANQKAFSEMGNNSKQFFSITGKEADTFYANQSKGWDTLGADFTDYNSVQTKGTEQSAQVMTKFTGTIQSTTKEMRGLRMAARELNMVGMMFTAVGGVLTASIVADANNYVKTVGRVNEQSAQWLQYQKDIKDANLEIGEVAVRAILPAMKTASEFVKDIADMLQAHPWMVQAALYVGGAMTAIGVAISVVSQITRTIAVIGLLQARLEAAMAKQAMMNAEGGVGAATYGPQTAGAAAGSAIGTVALFATAVIIGAEIGSIIGNAIAKMIYGDGYQKQNIGDAFMTVVKMFQIPILFMAQMIGKINPALGELANKLIGAVNAADASVSSAVGAGKGNGPDIAEQQALITEQETQAYIAFQKQMADATTNYAQQRADTVKQYEQQIADVTAQYEAQRAEAVSNFEKQMARSAEDFARGQAKALDDYNRSVAKTQKSIRDDEEKAQKDFQKTSQRNAQAHALEMQRLEQQHNMRLGDLAAQRDALGIVKENQAYAIARSQKEQDYRLAEQQRREDFQKQQAERRAEAADKLAELKANFEREQAEKLADREREVAQQRADQKERLAKMDADHKVQMAKMAEQEKEKLAKMKEAYDKQISQIQTAFVDRLRALDSAILGDTDAFTKHLQQQAIDFQNWLNAFKAAQTDGGVVNGGVVVSTGNGSAAGINNIMTSRNNGGQNNRSLSVSVQSRSLSMSEIKTQIDSALGQKLSDLLPAFGV